MCVCVLCFLLASHSLARLESCVGLRIMSFTSLSKSLIYLYVFIEVVLELCVLLLMMMRALGGCVCVCVRSMMQPKANTIFRLGEQAILGQYYTGAHNSHSDLCALFTNWTYFIALFAHKHAIIGPIFPHIKKPIWKNKKKQTENSATRNCVNELQARRRKRNLCVKNI